MDYREFLSRADIEAEVLEAWLAAGWLMPGTNEAQLSFAEVDLARARLIQELRTDIGVNDDGVGVILDLLDQLHGLRSTLLELLTAIRAQPENLRESLAVNVHRIRVERMGAPSPVAKRKVRTDAPPDAGPAA
jgi:chaperone modulatory protein CbpM